LKDTDVSEESAASISRVDVYGVDELAPLYEHFTRKFVMRGEKG
jgi:hypothetical protein